MHNFGLSALAALILVLVLILAAGCTTNQLALVEEIISAAETITPTIVGTLAPNDAMAVTAYVDAALSITNDLLINGTTQVGINEAVADFNNLVVPQLHGNAAVLISALVNSITVFLKNVSPATVTTARSTSQKAIVTLNAKDKVKIDKLRDRVQAARSRLKR